MKRTLYHHRSSIIVPMVILVLFQSRGISGFAAEKESHHWSRLPSGVRIFVTVPENTPIQDRSLILFATPNGNTIEQSFGCARVEGINWRFDIQHVGAQFRRFHQLDTGRRSIMAVVQSPKLSWPAFRRDTPNAAGIIKELVDDLVRQYNVSRVTLACHSGGGSFLFGYMQAHAEIPSMVERFVFLDANYSYSDAEPDHHGDKWLSWLRGSTDRKLIVVAYDDREIVLNGKKVVGPDGGTYRATQRTILRLRRELNLTEHDAPPFQRFSAMAGQIGIWLHPNPDNKILHTALVGEMNGLLHALCYGTRDESTWGTFGGPRAYSPFVPPSPLQEPESIRATIATTAPMRQLKLPTRPDDSPTGAQFRDRIARLARDERDQAIVREIRVGNVPSFLRTLKPIEVVGTDADGGRHSAVYFVMSDYLAIGSDEDFFRVPIPPRSACEIGDSIDCSLITTKISDDLFAAATVKLDPKPLTKDRDTVTTFFQHHEIIEEQLKGRLRTELVVGIKKDIVITNRLREKTHRVAIFGWHYPSGIAIQSLYVGHVDWYVDYSHGLRLVLNDMLVNGEPGRFPEIVRDPHLSYLVSNEGPIDIEDVRKVSMW